MLYTSLAVKLFLVPIFNAQREIIWSSTLQNSNGWLETSGSIVSDANCPVYSFCYELEGKSGDAELYRYDSTVGYHSIQVDYVMQSDDGKSNLNACELYTIFGQQSDLSADWTIRSSDVSQDQPLFKTVGLPAAADNEAIVGIDFLVNGGNNAFCYYNDVIVSGIPITEPQTKTPTKNPTTSTPTQQPTTKQPTTLIPTLYPSNNPTSFPITSAPTTLHPTVAITLDPTTLTPTSVPSPYPTSNNPTTSPTTHNPTTSPTTYNPSISPTTSDPTSQALSTVNMQTTEIDEDVVGDTTSINPIKTENTKYGDEKNESGETNNDQNMIIIILSAAVAVLVFVIFGYIIYRKCLNKKLNNETATNMTKISSISSVPKVEEVDMDIDGLIDLNPAVIQSSNDGSDKEGENVMIDTGDGLIGNDDDESDELYTNAIVQTPNDDIDGNESEEELYKINQTKGDYIVNGITDDINPQNERINLHEIDQPNVTVTKGYVDDNESLSDSSDSDNNTNQQTTKGAYPN